MTEPGAPEPAAPTVRAEAAPLPAVLPETSGEPAETGRSPWLPSIAQWLVPGAGHLLIGKPWPAVFSAGPIYALFLGGMALHGFENVSWERHPYMYALHALAGLPSVAATFLTRGLEITRPYPDHSVGDLFTMIAGLLNLVAIADVWARCASGDPEGRLPAESPAETPAQGAAGSAPEHAGV